MGKLCVMHCSSNMQVQVQCVDVDTNVCEFTKSTEPKAIASGNSVDNVINKIRQSALAQR